jgi:hypothetical protein
MFDGSDTGTLEARRAAPFTLQGIRNIGHLQRGKGFR